MKKAASARAGLTMIEVVVAAIILTAIVAMSSYLVWSSSRAVASSEAGLQLENTAREALDIMVQELRQAKRTGISSVNLVTLRTDPQFGNLHNRTVGDPKLGIAVSPCPEDTDFDGIRFELVDPRNTFNVNDFKNSQERTYIIQYWFQVEYDEQQLPAGVGAGPNGRLPNLVDDNRTGVVDEGTIMKMETTFAPDRVTIEERKTSTVLRNVKRLRFRVPSATSAADIAAGKPAYKSDRIEIRIDLEIQDPKHNLQNVPDKAGKEALIIQKSVSSIVDFRN
jgi:hypothetical protein